MKHYVTDLSVCESIWNYDYTFFTVALEGPVDNVCGQCNVLCLDTSDSMAGEAFQTMINLSLRFLSGLLFLFWIWFLYWLLVNWSVNDIRWYRVCYSYLSL